MNEDIPIGTTIVTVGTTWLETDVVLGCTREVCYRILRSCVYDSNMSVFEETTWPLRAIKSLMRGEYWQKETLQHKVLPPPEALQ
jgi:hypothetical protein